jgi:hypothetical protein
MTTSEEKRTAPHDGDRLGTLRRAAEGEVAPLSRHELAVALATAVRQWGPYESVPHPSPYRRDGGVQCRECKARGPSADQVQHRDTCRYELARRILDSAREEGLI